MRSSDVMASVALAFTLHLTVTSAIKLKNKELPIYEVDDSKGLGLTFEGIGAISGGGATTKLLYDYPADEAAKILDVLFTPGKGLSLQMLKVEIGGDTDSTEGAEPSHMHYPGDENYHRGYEWWLMKEAKKRNPDIKLYGLPWGWPGSLDPHATQETESKEVFADARTTANYTLNWILAAKRDHGLDIDYVGLWNEMDAPPEYRMALRTAIMSSEVRDRTQVLDRIVHYPGSTNTPDPYGCKQHQNLMLQPGEMWADEEGSMFDGRSARCLARVLNRNYISMCKTATIQWHLVSSFYDYLPWPRCGVAVADEPWSGAFEITSPTWAIAHTTQFAQIGWRYAAHNAGVSMLSQGGSIVTRVSPDMNDFSIVLEKMRSNTSICGHGSNPDAIVSSEEVVIALKGAFLQAARNKGGTLQVWRSNLESSSDYGVNPSPENVFQHVGPISVQDDGGGAVLRIEVHPEEIYTITTLNVGEKHVPESAPRKEFTLPYFQSFDWEERGKAPRLWYDVMGAFEVQDSPYGDAQKHGRVMRQVVPVFPNCWGYRCEAPGSFFGPSTLLGDITVSMAVRLEEEGEIYINPTGMNYSALSLSTKGRWGLGSPPHTTGSVDFRKDEWQSVTLRMLPDGSQIAMVNDEILKPDMSFRRIHKLKFEQMCDENNFPVLTKGRRFKGLKQNSAQSYEDCRKACCLDENLCDIFQWNGQRCEIGRHAEGFEKDLKHIWAGGARGEQTGWHLKLALSRYIHASIDNFRIYRTLDGDPFSQKLPDVHGFQSE